MKQEYANFNMYTLRDILYLWAYYKSTGYNIPSKKAEEVSVGVRPAYNILSNIGKSVL